MGKDQRKHEHIEKSSWTFPRLSVCRFCQQVAHITTFTVSQFL
jgi:hypothetical protein